MRVVFLPNNIVQEVEPGTNLLDAISAAGITIDGSCRGLGRCGCCRVQIMTGRCAPPDAAEQKVLSRDELAQGWRLACRVAVEDNLRLLIPNLTNADRRKTGLVFIPEDFVPDGAAGGLGAALDIGTTTMVGIVWQLSDGRLVDIEAMTNPQSVYGADVITRINFCGEAPENLQLMQDKVTGCFKQMLMQMSQRSGFAMENIRKAVVVGNTTMSHLFLAADPSNLAELPFSPAFTGPQLRCGQELDLGLSDTTPVLVLPNIAGHVGSDIVAGLLTCRLLQRSGLNLFIDLGTNGEVVLADNGNAWACSTAAGPAFEGAAIFQGMRAAGGAVEKVVFTEDGLQLQVIDGEEPRGICGSGLIDAIACLVTAGLIDRSGRLLKREAAEKAGIKPWLTQRLVLRQNMPCFLLWQGGDGKELLITQKDIREVQLGKGAIACGVKMLLAIAGKEAAQLDKVFLAGAFGNYVDKASALTIGLLPDVPQDRIISVGNSAGAGASMALLSDREKDEIIEQIKGIHHVELAQVEGFQDSFMSCMYFAKAK
ncbi:MAG: ASKHA domain-containing protein [Firmicutes bacterium]|nr:ASKHA domain-containing protein [Bacillota bacterium]